jgi:hypothetical protein
MPVHPKFVIGQISLRGRTITFYILQKGANMGTDLAFKISVIGVGILSTVTLGIALFTY